VISLNGIQGGQEKTSKIYGIAANNKSKKWLEQFKVEVIDEGVTTGVTALMLLELKKTELDAISILGNVQIQADYKASADIIQKLDEILGLSLSIEPLLEEAKETEKMLLEHFKK